jgi:hypothetical protein
MIDSGKQAEDNDIEKEKSGGIHEDHLRSGSGKERAVQFFPARGHKGGMAL